MYCKADVILILISNFSIDLSYLSVTWWLNDLNSVKSSLRKLYTFIWLMIFKHLPYVRWSWRLILHFHHLKYVLYILHCVLNITVDVSMTSAHFSNITVNRYFSEVRVQLTKTNTSLISINAHFPKFNVHFLKKYQCAPLKHWCAVLKISNAHFSSIKLRTSEISTMPFSHLCRISRDTAIISNLKISFVGNAFTGNNVEFWYWSGFRYKLDRHLSLLTTFSFRGIWPTKGI